MAQHLNIQIMGDGFKIWVDSTLKTFYCITTTGPDAVNPLKFQWFHEDWTLVESQEFIDNILWPAYHSCIE